MDTLHFTLPGSPINECTIALESQLNGFLNPSLNESHTEKIASYAQDNMGTIVAGILGELNTEHFIIQGLWVSNAFRKHGVGSKLLQLLENYALCKHIKAIILETNHSELMTFYAKNGYQVITSACIGEHRCTHYVLKKNLIRATKSGRY